MPDPQPQNLFVFRLQKWSEVKRALADLVIEKRREEEQREILLEKHYAYVEALKIAAEAPVTGDSLQAIDREIIRLLRPPVVQEFLKNPRDAYQRSRVTYELIMIAAATNNLGNFNPTPYTPEEMIASMFGQVPYYDDLTYLHTLRSVLGGSLDAAAYVPALFNALPDPKDSPATAAEYFWDDVLFRALTVNAVWQAFVFLTPEQQNFLLQNYFYQGLVLGVPIRAWLQEITSTNISDVDYRYLSATFFKAIERNNEPVPVDTETMITAPFAEILKSYLAVVYNEPLATLAQEKFINEIYSNQPFSAEYSSWLREALSISLYLKKGTETDNRKIMYV